MFHDFPIDICVDPIGYPVGNWDVYDRTIRYTKVHDIMT